MRILQILDKTALYDLKGLKGKYHSHGLEGCIDSQLGGGGGER